MEATKLLTKQHEEVSALFKKIEKASGREARTLVTELAKNLLSHMIIEQTLFYPAAAEAELDIVLEGYEEHVVARTGLIALLETETGDETFKAKAIVLKELIEHHVKEEQNDMFPKVKKAMESERLETLGTEMEEVFNELVTLSVASLEKQADQIAHLADTRRKKRKSNSQSAHA